ncbi:hypothetical protein BC829DRAFT_3422 [Chytridium lagenaria]|nr:hypothetical protein BC829DRAFT_3422 [Chytridium lagenaria]
MRTLRLEERLRLLKRRGKMFKVTFCYVKINSLVSQETLTAALAATSDTELQLDAKNTELEQLRKENRLATRDRDDAERRLAVELASWDKTKAEWATKEAHYKEAVKSHAKVNKELKTETVLKEEILSGAFEEQQSVVLETAKSAMREKDSVIAKLHETLIKLESGNADVSTRLSIAYDEITSLRNEIEELRVQNRSLIEDNELYQVLLRERTLNGEFKTKSVVMGGAYFDDDLPPPRASLSDELDGTSQASKSSKSQLSELEEQVKALKLFIDVI